MKNSCKTLQNRLKCVIVKLIMRKISPIMLQVIISRLDMYLLYYVQNEMYAALESYF